tara:strand:- start:1078 stop:2499 length:1422 start_codon:yes stop_codon:yes gene_type:complete
MNHKSILYFLGIYSLFVSFFSLLNILYSIYFNSSSGLSSYLITLIISLALGILFYLIGRHYSKNISLSDQIIFIVSSFVFIPLLISIPYFFNINNFGLLNSYFESVSGITTTGFSVIKNMKEIDEPLILWRSSSQWLGGLFFLIAVVATIGSKQIKIKPAYLVSRESSGINFYNNFNYNFIKILLIYFFSTIFVIFLYSLINVRLLDAFNLAFTSISAGGFIPTNDLSNIINKELQIYVLSATLLFPIFNFYLLFNIFTKQFSLKNHQEDLYLGILILLLTLLFYFFIIPNTKLSDIFLAITSSLSTSGIAARYANFDVSLFFLILTIIGGSLISTSSGIKFVRFYILLKISYQEIYRLVKPINVFNKNLFNTESKIGEEDSKIAFLVFILFIISLFILSGILTLDVLTFESAFKLSILTLTNTASSSIYGLDNLHFFDLNSFTKISLIIFMILGKIEIIAVLYLIKRFIFEE